MSTSICESCFWSAWPTSGGSEGMCLNSTLTIPACWTITINPIFKGDAGIQECAAWAPGSVEKMRAAHCRGIAECIECPHFEKCTKGV